MAQIYTTRMTAEEARQQYGINLWQTWSCEAETFGWSYAETETCFLLEGEADILHDGEVTHISQGMLVQFPAGLTCEWQVSKPISKRYQFGKLELR